MAAIFDMTRRVTSDKEAEHQLKDRMEEEEEYESEDENGQIVTYRRERRPTIYITVEKLPEKVMLHIFAYIGHKEILKAAQVCRQWAQIAHNPALWQSVSFRPNYGGLQVRLR
uniref:F-box domain-containing protein n=1 Tax=Plectus sambesii TaxID=2011161 RepID=A0A914X3V5_9BILA